VKPGSANQRRPWKIDQDSWIKNAVRLMAPHLEFAVPDTRIHAMSADLVERARGGDSGAFAELIGPHAAELRAHCYRMLGSLADADDALQDALLAAWQGLADSAATPRSARGSTR
jgi:hypothetical protein